MGKWPVVTLIAAALGGCSTMPVAGPSVGEIESARQTESAPEGIELLSLDRAAVEKISSFRTPPLAGRFGDRRPSPNLTVGIGDTLVVSIYEAGTGGLFSGPQTQLGGGTKSVTLQPQLVGSSGSVSVPYAGQIQVAGRTTEQIEKAIVDKLRDKAIEPQALVTVHSPRSNLVTVNGELGGAGRVPLSPRGDRILDVIAGAGGNGTGGLKAPMSELFVRLTRDGVTASAPLATIVEDPSQNIWARPGDQIFIYRDPQSFTALGATGRSGNFTFEYDRMSLAQAIGAASGLNDEKAEPAGIFVYRLENANVVCAIKGERPCRAPTVDRPVVYRLNLRVAEGIQLAQRVPVRNRDVLYVANAEGAEIYKVMRLLSSGSSTVGNAALAGQRIHNW